MYIEHIDEMIKKIKKKGEKQQNNPLWNCYKNKEDKNPNGYALAGGSSFWLGWERGESLALGSISWFPAFASFIFAAFLALADGFFHLSLPFYPSAP